MWRRRASRWRADPGQAGKINYGAIPGVTYTFPEVPSVSPTEDALKAQGVAYNKGELSFMANKRARCNIDADGFVKVVADEQTDQTAHHRVQMISEGVGALDYVASIEDLARASCAPGPV